MRLIHVAIFLLPLGLSQAQGQPAVSDMWLDVSLGGPLIDWFNSVARPEDIARVENVSQLNLLDNITIGRKLVVFKSAAEAERLLPEIADRVDILGYNLEHGPANPADEQSDPVRSVQRMRALADQYGLMLAIGPDHDFALSHGAAVAPFVDIFVLQVQRVQTRPQTVLDFVLPLVPELRAANPDLQISIQVRTEGDVAAIADLVESLKEDLNGVSILTSPETTTVAEALVTELRGRTGTNTTPAATSTTPDPISAAPAATPAAPAATSTPFSAGPFFLLVGILAVIGGLVGLLILFGKRAAPP
jgi:hypothetical protein